MEENHEKEYLLNYIPLSKQETDWKKLVRKRTAEFFHELSSFWSFFWRWLLLYAPNWAILMMLYRELSLSS